MIKVTREYRFLLDKGPVKVYNLQGIPFTWDELTKSEIDEPSVLTELANNDIITLDDILNGSSYLILEGLHPLIYEIALDPESELPDSVSLDD